MGLFKRRVSFISIPPFLRSVVKPYDPPVSLSLESYVRGFQVLFPRIELSRTKADGTRK